MNGQELGKQCESVNVKVSGLVFVTDTIDGADRIGRDAQFQYFFAQLLDVAVDCSITDDAIVRVDVRHQVIARIDTPRTVERS